MIRKTAEGHRDKKQWISVSLTVGGGIKSIQDIQDMMDIGVSKVSMNTAAVVNPELVKEASEKFGSERIVVAIDTRTSPEMPSGFEVMVNGGNKPTGIDAVKVGKGS